MKDNHPMDADHTALTDQIMAQQGFLRRLALGLVRDEATAEDLVQDTFALALRRPEEGPPPRAWLVRVVQRLAQSRYRSEGRRSAREQRVAREEQIPSHAQAIDRRIDLHATLAQQLRALPAQQARALVMRYGEDLTPKQIAIELQVPLPTVKARLRRGLQQLRLRMDTQHGGKREAWALALLSPTDASQHVLPLEPVAMGGAAGVGMPTLLGLIAMGVTVALLGRLLMPGSHSTPPSAATTPHQMESPIATLSESGMESPAASPRKSPSPALVRASAIEPNSKAGAPSRAPSKREAPRLAMAFDRQDTKGANLRVSFVGEQDSILSGFVFFDAPDLPSRSVEMRGRSGNRERTLNMIVPPDTSITLHVDLDGLEPFTETLNSPSSGEWLDYDVHLTQLSTASRVVLDFQGDHRLDGVSTLIQLHQEEGKALLMPMRSPVVRDGQLDLGFLPAGTFSVFGRPSPTGNALDDNATAFSATAQVARGQHATIPSRIQATGGIQLLALNSKDETVRAKVTIQLAGGQEIPGLHLGRKRLPPHPGQHEATGLLPKLPPGPVTLILNNPGHLTIHRQVTILAGQDQRLDVRFEPLLGEEPQVQSEGPSRSGG